jgi:hypothetical protein
MNRAEIESVYPDEARAHEFLGHARGFFADAESPSLTQPGSFFLLYQACLAGMDALLAATGSRVTSGEESHRVRIDEAARIAGSAYTELFERLDVWRADRNQVSYAAFEPSGGAVNALRTDASDLLDTVERILAEERG